ncbi:diguanylate cyclase domain-containing protein [Burkholderia sp. MSMB1072]|uniref:diguanylate cyclase domain-containing protein n=1 Tax=Burkholderia sp. MSMB1072 TaxID=1637871 RepID=UPI0009E8EFA3|nr:diguanylate cyclase [Burkholderia sp. MSMB1072]
MNGKNCAVARRTAGPPDRRTGILPARDGSPGLGRDPCRPRGTRCRGRRVCYRKHAPRDGFSSRKTDLDQIVDPTALSSAHGRSTRLARQVGKSFRFDGHALRLGVGIGIGIATPPADGTDMNALIERADRAMYEAKRMRSRRSAPA